VSSVERMAIRSLAMRLVPGHWSRICISFPVACWSQYGHNFWSYVIRCEFSMVAFSMVNLWVGIN